jgi:hypothetical protein
MTQPPQFPAGFIGAADQAHADINSRLDMMVTAMRVDIAMRSLSPELSFVSFALFFREKGQQHFLADLAAAALVRLATQESA